MNPLVQLYECLTYSTIMEAQRLDRKLKQCMEALAPEAHKSTAHGTLYAGLTALVQAAPEHRERLLQTLLEQVDTVLCTQPQFGEAGELLGTVRNISALQAHTRTGAERVEMLTDMLCTHPEYVTDPRVLRMLIADLADTDTAVTALAFRILQATATGQPVELHTRSGRMDNRCFVPRVDTRQLVLALKHGFDPQGGEEMTRRLMLVCILAGGAENNWYLSLLHRAQPTLRALILFALGCRKENIPLLLELAQREHGKAEEMAYRALALWDTPQVLVFWERTLCREAGRAVYLSTATQDVYGDFVARHLRIVLEQVIGQPHISRQQMDSAILPWIQALRNKASDGVIACYQWLLDQRTQLPPIRTMEGALTHEIFPLVHEKICETLLLRCPKKLVGFLRRRREPCLQEACFLAELLTLPAAAVYDHWKTTPAEQLRPWFGCMGRDATAYYVTRQIKPIADGQKMLKRALKEPPDRRWLDVLQDNDYADLFPPKETNAGQWHERLRSHFTRQGADHTKSSRVSQGHLSGLRERLLKMHESGAENAEYIVANLCNAYVPSADTSCSPTDLEEAAQEIQRVLDFYHTVSQNTATADNILNMRKDNGLFRGNPDSRET